MTFEIASFRVNHRQSRLMFKQINESVVSDRSEVPRLILTTYVIKRWFCLSLLPAGIHHSVEKDPRGR